MAAISIGASAGTMSETAILSHSTSSPVSLVQPSITIIDQLCQHIHLTPCTTVPTQTIAPPPTNPTRQNLADTDGNYFVNCKDSHGTVSSGMAYYKNLDPGSNVGQQPDDYIDVTHGSLVTWESTGVVAFNSGVPVHWSIFGNAQDLGPNQSAGTADNMYEHFWVYKDAQEWLYSVDDCNCYLIYWAF
jgi:hypothetical protein